MPKPPEWQPEWNEGEAMSDDVGASALLKFRVIPFWARVKLVQ
jgi:hypothetical protein